MAGGRRIHNTPQVGNLVSNLPQNKIFTLSESPPSGGREAGLDNPHWGWHAAQALGAEVKRPPQYARAAPAMWPGAVYRD